MAPMKQEKPGKHCHASPVSMPSDTSYLTLHLHYNMRGEVDKITQTAIYLIVR